MPQFHAIFNIKPMPRKESKSGRYGRYKDIDNEAYQRAIALNAKVKHNGILLKGALRADITFHMQIPKSYSQKKKDALLGEFHWKRPDVDNLQKLIFDALNEIVYKDDGQISWVVAKKLYSKNPHIEVIISEI